MASGPVHYSDQVMTISANAQPMEITDEDF